MDTNFQTKVDPSYSVTFSKGMKLSENYAEKWQERMMIEAKSQMVFNEKPLDSMF